ncbi:MAG: heavy metal translocating P-type ATPase [Chloroflexota bacterium]
MLIKLRAAVNNIYMDTRERKRKRFKNTLVTSLTAGEASSLRPTASSLALQEVTKFQNNHLDPFLDTMYTSGEAIIQRYFGLDKQVLPQDAADLSQYNRGEITQTERKINRTLALSVLMFTLNTTSIIFYPPMMWLSVPFLLKRTLSNIQEAFSDIVHEQKIGVPMLVGIGMTSYLLLRKFWIFSLFSMLYVFSQKFLYKTRDVSQQNLVSLWGDMPQTVWCQKNGVEVEVALENIQTGDNIIVHAGELIPVDGTIASGYATIDEHMLTGEGRPVEKGINNGVYAGTMLLSGSIVVCVEQMGEKTLTGQIGEILKQTSDYRTTIELTGERIANQSVIPTLALSAVAWGVLGPVSASALLSCSVGFQLRYTGPLCVLNFLQITAKEGIFVKDGRALELLTGVDTVVFDKTGTLTLEQLTVGEIHSFSTYTEIALLRYAAAVEHKQSHPIAHAILDEANLRQLDIPTISDTIYSTGFGLEATIEEKNGSTHRLQIGSERYVQNGQTDNAELLQAVQAKCDQEGNSVVYIAIDNQVVGAIELIPTTRPEAIEVIRALKARDLELFIISGDQVQPTRRLASLLGIDHFFAQVLPKDKAELVAQLQQSGKSVCFIGDGINDSIALKKANVSISLRGATTLATDTAQIILMDGTLQQLPKLFTLADKLESSMQRVFLAGTMPGIICVTGVFLLHFGIFTASTLAWIGLSTGITNAMQPLLNYRRKPNVYLDRSDVD